MIIKYDCRHFKGSMPCRPHKEHGVHCEGCAHYDAIGFRILVIKLDAVGDVLRTTAILPGLKEKYPAANITWVTRRESLPLFENNRLADLVLEYGAAAHLRAASSRYDLVINTDASADGALLAERAAGVEKKGFGYDPKGHVYPFGKEAVKWFEMGLFDDVKKKNSETYQKIICDMIGIKESPRGIVLELSDAERRFAAEFAERHGLKPSGLKIGLNTGAGARWEKKKWTLDGFFALIERIRKEMPEAKVLLYGGAEERERNARIKERFGNAVIDTGCDNGLRQFFALIGLVDVFVTGDTMALHAATALGKKVVALFGPTPHAKIELYGRGEKLYADMECLSCYRQSCGVKPDCMEAIPAGAVYEAIRKLV